VIRWLDLGHTHATLLADGVPVDVVCERLGQASATVMLTIHQRVRPVTGRHAADGPGIMRSRTR
jgi:integrase